LLDSLLLQLQPPAAAAAGSGLVRQVMLHTL
jgi:hypothetical protein